MTQDFAKLRQEMVARQLVSRGIRHQGVLAAMAEAPREMFVPPDRLEEAYEDRPLPIGLGQTISQPYIVALMVQELDPRAGHRVLDIGAGSGYQTAILSRLAAHVYAMERFEQLTERAMAVLGAMNISNVTICTGDGSVGWPEEAPFDRIICGAGAPDVPQAWIDQLADGGRIVVPTGGQDCQTLVRIDKVRGQVTRKEICDVRFVKLVGREGWPA
jgi:protein-L-isoaspartate(D-aspartate) O-methyltransferase